MTHFIGCLQTETKNRLDLMHHWT